MPAFEAKCSMKLGEGNPGELHSTLSEFSSLSEGRSDVLEAFFTPRDRQADVEFLLEADDEARAIALAENLIGEIEEAAARRFGTGVVTRGHLEVQPEDDTTEAILDQLARMIDPSSAGGILADLEDEAADVPLGDPFEAMREAGTNGANFDLETEDIIERFQSWSRTASFEIVDVGSSFVTVVFEEPPDDLAAFAAEAYVFCPDLADDLEELDEADDDDEAEELALKGIAKQIREERVLRFWWD